MSDHTNGFIVTLQHDMRVDDAEESIIAAIGMIKGVLSVKPVVTDFNLHFAKEQVRDEYRRKIFEALK